MFPWSKSFDEKGDGKNKKPSERTRHDRIVNYDNGTVLFKAIEERQWQSTLSRMTMCPHEVSTYVYRLDKNRTKTSDKPSYQFISLPLHAAVKQQPPTIIISALLASYPKAASTKCDGELPLHIAIKNGASLDVIQTLVVAYPRGLDEPDAIKQLPIEIFEDRKEKLWKDEREKHAIAKLLSDGLKNVVMKNGGGSSSSSGRISMEDKEDEKNSLKTSLREEGWLKTSGLTIIIIGASGDLAKKKTYPSLLRLFYDKLLPATITIWGYARSSMEHVELRERLKPYLQKSGNYPIEIIEEFLECCFYQSGKSYGDSTAYQHLGDVISQHEDNLGSLTCHNRLFYFAIPPNVFGDTGVAIKENAMASKGWTRVIIEKPFGRDLQSCEELLSTLSTHFEEQQMFRIDHYLGKEMVQNLLAMRFGNLWFERLWNRDNIECVMLTFKEPFGTDGRGGYFDKYGIIRDIIQNHLLQVLTLLAMEAPTKIDGSDAGESIRDAKVKVLSAIPPIPMSDCFLGQYEGYANDPTIENKDTNTPTFAIIRVFVNTPRWSGVPFIFKAGKAVNERKAEMRIQFKDPPGANFLFESKCPRNELVMRLQPNEAIYMKTNVKTPGISSALIQKELEVNYDDRFSELGENGSPDAYTRLILDVLRGKSATFVREDELRRAWEIFTPLLHKIESENIRPEIYKTGTRGPATADDFIAIKSGYIRNDDYVFNNGKVIKSNL